MAVTADQLIVARLPGTGRITQVKVEAGEILYAGTLAFLDADGYCTPDIATGSNRFAGIVRKQADNTAGADGAIEAELYTEGDFVLPFTSVAQADLTPGLCYAVDNYAVNATAASQSYVGLAMRVAGTSLVEVRLDIQLRPDAT